MFNLLKSLWSWLTGHADKQRVPPLTERPPEEPIPEVPMPKKPASPIRKGSLEDIRDFCDEIRKDLSIRKRLDDLRKKTDDRLYVEVGNLRDRIVRFLEGKGR